MLQQHGQGIKKKRQKRITIQPTPLELKGILSAAVDLMLAIFNLNAPLLLAPTRLLITAILALGMKFRRIEQLLTDFATFHVMLRIPLGQN